MKRNLISLALGIMLGTPLSLYAVSQQSGCEVTQAYYSEEKPIQLNIELNNDDRAYYIVKAKQQAAAELALNDMGIVVPIEIKTITEEVGKKYGIAPELLQAIIFKESSFVATAENGDCKGLMQINMGCAERAEDVKSINASENAVLDMRVNVEAGAMLLSDLFNDYEDVAEVLIRYNGDKSGLKKYKENGTISDYASEILRISELLERSEGN